MGGFCMAFHYQRVCMTKEENYRKEAMNLEVQKTFYDIHQEKSLESKWVGDGFFPPTALTLGSQPR